MKMTQAQKNILLTILDKKKQDRLSMACIIGYGFQAGRERFGDAEVPTDAEFKTLYGYSDDEIEQFKIGYNSQAYEELLTEKFPNLSEQEVKDQVLETVLKH